MSSAPSKDALMASLMGESAPAAASAPVDVANYDGPEEDLFGSIPLDNDPTPTIMGGVSPMGAMSPMMGGAMPAVTNNPLESSAAASTAAAPVPSTVENPLFSPAPVAPSAVTSTTTAPNVATAPPPIAAPAPPAAAPSARSSLLESSGLLGIATTDSNGGVDGGGGGGGGGGLFDEIDKEEEERLRREAEEARRRQEEEERKRREAELERQRQEQERLRIQQQEEEQRRRRMEEQQRRAMEEEQQKQRMMMQQQPQPQPSPYGMQHQANGMQVNGMQTIPLASSMTTAPYGQQQQQKQPAVAAAQQQSYVQRQQNLTNQMQGMTLSSSYHVGMGATNAYSSNNSMATPQKPPPPTANDSIGGFYRNHQETTSPPPPHPPSNSYMYTSTGGAVQQHNFAPSASTSRLSKSVPSLTAGMHNRSTRNVMQSTPKLPPVTAPPAFEQMYISITVSEPLLVQPPSLFNMVPPHWTYQVQAGLQQGGCYLVRRRFRHVVALEDRLRQECAGCILPGRPDKHATRAIEETGALQSKEFADQRAHEIQVYLSSLAKHPYAGRSNSLRLFLALQDDMGTAWPEVSSNALTRISAVSGTTVNNLTEQTVPAAMNHTHLSNDALEDDAELLALSSSESLRMGAVVQAVPKLEGSITLMREHGECAGAVGMELNKLGKEVEATDRELGVPIEILSQGLLRYGRRQKRVAVELGAAMTPFASQYKLCKNESKAFVDRRVALQRRLKERGKADARAQKLMLQQYNMQQQGPGYMDHLERDATMSDAMANDAVAVAERVGQILKSEVNRVAYERRTEWSKSCKILASALKEACAEERAIWEATQDSFLQAFPEYDVNNQKMPPTAAAAARPST